MRRSSRTTFSFPDFSLRRLLLQGARVARGSPPLGQRLCDVEKGNGKNDKNSASSSSGATNKHNSESVSQRSGTPPPPPPAQQHTPQNVNNLKHKSSPSQQTHSNSVVNSPKTSNTSDNNECPLCYNSVGNEDFYSLLVCQHYACRGCLESYLMIEITESRTDIACPQCSDAMHPSDIQTLLQNYPAIIAKYEDFMVRRVLLSDPDSRWCPAPDCSFAVIATSCASCPRISCERPGCSVQFCYHCKAEWHPDQTCDAARTSRQSPTRASGSIADSQHRGDEIKPCPRCQVLIVKMDDGSCNHMVCAVCGSEFCWLCMKQISDLHYLSPSGCTFWGKKPWSRKKKLLWQLGTLVGAPVGIALVAGISVPAMIIGIPVWVGRKIHTRYKTAGKHKRNCAVLGGVAASIIVSPVLAGLAVAVGVPILLFYVYGVVPVSLCRAGCGVSTTRDGVKFEFDEEEDNGSRNHDAASVDAVSRIGATSIGEVSLSVASGSHLGVATHNSTFGAAHSLSSNRESTTALAGSITGHRLEVQADVSSSETASAVTCVSEKSGGNLSSDTASTRALAGSILSYKIHSDSANVSEDGERVRFDSNVYLIDDKKESCDMWYSEGCPEKASLGSGRSFRGSERSFRDDLDTSSLCSVHKRLTNLTQRIPKLSNSQHRTLSVESGSGASNNIPENVSLEQSELIPPSPQPLSTPPLPPKVISNSSDSPELPQATGDDNDVSTEAATNQPDAKVTTKEKSSKNMSKSNVLRNLFFFQNENGSSKS